MEMYAISARGHVVAEAPRSANLQMVLERSGLRKRPGWLGLFPCRLAGACGGCRLRILAGETSSLTPMELKRLRPAEVAEGQRLACQVLVRGPLEIRCDGAGWRRAFALRFWSR